MTLQHPLAELSAYIDGALDPAAYAAVDGHLSTCGECRMRAAQLRGTASLIGALSDPVPTRRLVPRLTPPAWLAPMRTLATLASGAAVFMFLASALLANVGTLATSPAAATALDPANRERAAQAPAPQAGAATALPSGAPAPTASSNAPFGLVSPQPVIRGTAPVTDAAASPSEAAQKRSDTSSTATPPAAAVAEQSAARAASVGPQRPEPPSPWVWLALAVISGAIAFASHRRLRSSV
ncbi:MAG TPA: zf-HC2 domain-containing protein [Candidatus Limnocylindria bacterium]|nr:zf-HC2 domain-containing protein [Candidatus Limnocylindria bacterium]